MRNPLTALRLILVMMILTGILYPLIITGVAQTLFPHQANGSIITVDGRIAGSALVGQKFLAARYFWSRPSAIDYNPMPSGATNAGPTSSALREAVQMRRASLDTAHASSSPATAPVEMLFASASGVDPHISPEAARLQLDLVARARGFTPAQKAALEDLVQRCIESPQWGMFGEPRVNVFLLNVALDELNRPEYP